MANRPYLLNTAFLTSDPYLVESRRTKDGIDYVEVDGPGYRLPVPWLCCFRPDDLKPVEVPLEGGGTVRRRLPSTTREEAIRNLERALPQYVRITGEARLARRYWEEAVAWLRVLPLPYLMLNHLELLDVVADEGEQDLLRALAGDAGAVPYLKEYADYVDGARPYAPDVLKSVPGPYRDKRRLDNAMALDACASGQWRRAGDYVYEPPLTVPVPPGRHDLSVVHEHVVTMLRGRDRDADASFGFAPFTGMGQRQLKMLLSPRTDRLRDKLLSDQRLRDALDGFIGETLRAICADQGFEWTGFVIESNQALKRRFDDINEWVRLAPAY